MIGAGKIVRVGGFNLSTLTSSILGIRQGGFDTLMKPLFANGEQGFAYDPNDLTTLYQDAAGNIPVTAAGQPVGLMLDKSKGLVLGSNIVPNGSFSSDTSWNKGTGWTIADGVARFDGSASFSNLGGVALSSINGKWLRVEFDLSNVGVSVTQVRVLASGVLAATIPVSGAGKYSAMVLGGSTPSIGIQTQFATGANNAFSLDNVSLKELAGNHAYQAASAARPIFRQTPILGNELVINGDFSNGKTGWGGIYGGVLSTQNGNLVITSDGTSEFAGAFQQYNFVSGRRYKISFKVVDASQSAGVYGFVSANNTGSINRVLTSSMVVSAGFYEAEFTAANDTKYITIGAGAGGLLAGEAIYFDNVSVKEVLGYRTDQNYLEFDGSDDFLVTNSIDFTATDEVSLFTGVRKLSDANTAVVSELSTTSDNGKAFTLFAPALPGRAKFLFRSGGSSVDLSGGASSMDTKYSAPFTVVAVGRAKISTDYMSLKLNGAVVGDAITDQGAGNYGNLPLYIGRRGGSTLPFGGHIYGLIGVGKLTTDDETAVIEKELAKRTGVTLSV